MSENGLSRSQTAAPFDPAQPAAPATEIVERVARAICCGNGPCHTEEVKKREGGKYLMDLPCYATSPDVVGHARLAIEAMREPTRDMLDGSRRALGKYICSLPKEEREKVVGKKGGFKVYDEYLKARVRFQAMIDVALGKAP